MAKHLLKAPGSVGGPTTQAARISYPPAKPGAFRAIAAVLLLGVGGLHSHAEVPVVPPEQLGLDAAQLARIDALVAAEIEAKKLPGAVVTIGRTGGVGFQKAYGRRQIEPAEEAMTVDTVFDMASLTKPVATATSIMILVERGDVRLRNPVADYLPEFAAERQRARHRRGPARASRRVDSRQLAEGLPGRR